MLGFVVRARNEEQYIGFALQSIFDKFGDKTQVVVVDNESTDDTLKVVKSFPTRFFDIKVIHLGNHDYTPGRSLNLGISALKDSGCKFAGILSSHCEISELNKDTIGLHFKDEKCFALMGKQIPIRQGKRISPRYIWANFCHTGVTRNIKEETLLTEDRYFFHNAFSFVRIEHWEDIKFDENLSGKEDRYWAKDQIDKGRHFIFDPRIVCRHFWTEKGATWRD